MVLKFGETSEQKILAGDHEITAISKPRWIFRDAENVVLQLYFANTDLLIIQAKANVPKAVYKSIFLKIEEIILSADQKLSVLVYAQTKFLGREVRSFIINEEHRLRNYIDRYYFISKGHGKNLLNVYKNMHPFFKDKLMVLSSFNEAILEHLHDKSSPVSNLSKVFNFQIEASKFPIELKWKSYFLSIRHLPEWSYRTDGIEFKGFLINGKIILFKIRGNVNQSDVVKISAVGKNILHSAEQTKVIIISDYSEVDKITRGARYEFERYNIATDPVRIIEFTYANPLIGAVISLQQMMNEKLDRSIFQTLSFNEALEGALKRSGIHDKRQSIKPELVLSNLSQAQLKKKLRDLHHEKIEILNNQAERIDQLIEMFSRVTWQQDLNFEPFIPEEEDPFHNLFSAFHFLKKDLKSLFKEIHILNYNLEEKVKEKAGDLLKKEANLESVLEATNDLVVLLNEKYEIIVMNSALKEFFRLNIDMEIQLGDSFTKIFINDNIKKFWLENLEKAFEGNQFSLTDRWKTFTGDIVHLNFSFNPIRSSADIVGVSVFVKDVTEQILNNEKLAIQNEDLTKLNQQLDRFIYSASHELRSPVSSLMGLLNNYELEGNQEFRNQYLLLMKKAVANLDLYIKDILIFTTSTKDRLKIEKVNIREEIMGIVNSLEEPINKYAINVKLNIAAEDILKIDKFRLKVILNNLISNAIYFYDPQKEDKRVEIGVKHNDDDVVFVISDNGVGIPENLQKNVFTMFYRGHERSKGSGLGLFLVKEAVEFLKGSILLKSEEGKGTNFEVKIPERKYFLES